ncbi:hypothetical protein TWF594_002165 [Orbilia oligospora]|nr:hypothetical protein TWF594_002165 [Orbilia oligospora]
MKYAKEGKKGAGQGLGIYNKSKVPISRVIPCDPARFFKDFPSVGQSCAAGWVDVVKFGAPANEGDGREREEKRPDGQSLVRHGAKSGRTPPL